MIPSLPVNHWLKAGSRVARCATAIIWPFLLSTALISQQACNGYGKIINQSHVLAEKLTKQPEPSASETTSIEQRIYIDHSESMAGFVGDLRSGKRTSFDQFIDALPAVLPSCKVFKYGQPRRDAPIRGLQDIAIEVEFDGRLHDKRNYSLEYNPDEALIESLVAEKEPILSILLNDGVESDSMGRVNTTMVDVIERWLSQGKSLAILIMKSRFSGRFYSESQRRMIEDVTVESRPFYAFVFSPSIREIDDLIDKLNSVGGLQMKSIIFSDRSITGRVELPANLRASYATEQPPSKQYYWQLFETKKVNPENEEGFIYRFIYEIGPNYPVKSLGLRLDFRHHRWDANSDQFQAEGTLLPIEIKSESRNAGSDHQPEGTNPDDPGKDTRTGRSFFFSGNGLSNIDIQSNYMFFSAEPFPYVKEIDDDLLNLSTRDDGERENAGKTYRLQDLIYAITNAHIKSRLIPRLSQGLFITGVN